MNNIVSSSAVAPRTLPGGLHHFKEGSSLRVQGTLFPRTLLTAHHTSPQPLCSYEILYDVN